MASDSRIVVEVEKWYGRYGNNVRQVIHAIENGIDIGADVVALPPHPHMLSRNVSLRGAVKSPKDRAKLPPPLTYDRDFFGRHSEEPIRFQADVWRLARPVVQFAPLAPSAAKSSYKRAIIHLRSGDIWQYAHALRHYPIMPVSFFSALAERAITLLGVTEILILAEDNCNPLSFALKDRLLEEYPNVFVHVEILDFDATIYALQTAEVVILSVGTFVSATVLFSDAIRHIFLIDDPFFVYLTNMDDFLLRERGVHVHRIPKTREMSQYITEWQRDGTDRQTRINMILASDIVPNFSRIINAVASRPQFAVVSYFTRGPPHDSGLDLSNVAASYRRMIAPHADYTRFFTKQSLYATVPSSIGTAEDRSKDRAEYENLTEVCKSWHRIGMFQWKPHLLLHLATESEEISEGDIVMYHGVNFVKYPAYANGIPDWRRTCETLLEKCGSDVYVTPDAGSLMRHDVKRWLIDRYLGPEYSSVLAFWGDLIIFRKSPQSRTILGRWRDMCDLADNLSILPDSPESYYGFVRHTHDQAVLTVLIYLLQQEGTLSETYPNMVARRRDLTDLKEV